jgi:hypothetical protein
MILQKLLKNNTDFQPEIFLYKNIANLSFMNENYFLGQKKEHDVFRALLVLYVSG